MVLVVFKGHYYFILQFIVLLNAQLIFQWLNELMDINSANGVSKILSADLEGGGWEANDKESINMNLKGQYGQEQ